MLYPPTAWCYWIRLRTKTSRQKYKNICNGNKSSKFICRRILQAAYIVLHWCNTGNIWQVFIAICMSSYVFICGVLYTAEPQYGAVWIFRDSCAVLGCWYYQWELTALCYTVVRARTSCTRQQKSAHESWTRCGYTYSTTSMIYYLIVPYHAYVVYIMSLNCCFVNMHSRTT